MLKYHPGAKDQADRKYDDDPHEKQKGDDRKHDDDDLLQRKYDAAVEKC